MNSKIAMSGLSILASFAIMGGATFAFFSSASTSSANTFGAGSMNLELDDNDEVFGDNSNNNVTATFNVTNMVPNQSEAQLISVHNTGTTPIAEIALGLTATATDDSSPDGSDLRDQLNLKVVPGGTTSSGPNGTVCSGGSDVTAAIDLAVGNNDGTLTFNEFTGDNYDSLATPLAVGGNSNVCMEVTMNSLANDNYQGDSAGATFTFTAHQDISQI